MGAWDLSIELDAASRVPLYLQLTRGIIDAIASGRIVPGRRLPGTRSLAGTLRVHRNTVSAAYDELLAEGWITARSRSGTFVSEALPRSEGVGFGGPSPEKPHGHGRAGAAIYRTARTPAPWRSTAPRGHVDLVGGRPDLSLVPAVELARAYARAMRRHRSGLLGYGDPRGHERLRTAVADMLRSTRGLTVTAENVLITNGSQMALHVAARALVRPGVGVAVEALGYRSAWESLRAAGARLRPVPVDQEGLRVDRLAALCAREPIGAVYVTPHHQYPTTVPLSPRRRMDLLHLARVRRFAILEDDYDHEVHFDGHPLVPLAAADRLETTLYIGSLSKIFAPGLRLGYAVAPRDVVDSLGAQRSVIDLSGNAGIEVAVAELFEEGEVQRHLRRMVRIYRVRRDALTEVLRRHLGEVLEFDIPTGGTAIWCRMRDGRSPDGWVERSRNAGVLFQSGSSFSFVKRRVPAVRLGFTRATESEIARGVRLIARVLGVR